MTRKLILEGWNSYRRKVLEPAGAGSVQIEECRCAFYFGAMILFASIMGILDPGSEATPKDLAQMSAIHDEIEQYAVDMKAQAREMGD